MAEIASSTQKFIDIFEIVEDVVILNNGCVSEIIQVGTINFGLLSEEEQDAAIFAYASILNSLNFPIQIVIKTQTKDITNYLNHLSDAEAKAKNPTHKAQIARYREFVKDWVKNSNVLDKRFFVVITADPVDLGITTPKNVLNQQADLNLNRYELKPIIEKAKNSLDAKRDHLISQFARLGLGARQITTQEIIKLFYNSYNPDSNEGVELINSQEYSAPIVTAGVVSHQLTQEG
ncbi:MAG: hypothetical protein Q4G02_02430 [bacterium]|nr:hypothetical protein [bacterium]